MSIFVGLLLLFYQLTRTCSFTSSVNRNLHPIQRTRPLQIQTSHLSKRIWNNSPTLTITETAVKNSQQLKSPKKNRGVLQAIWWYSVGWIFHLLSKVFRFLFVRKSDTKEKTQDNNESQDIMVTSVETQIELNKLFPRVNTVNSATVATIINTPFDDSLQIEAKRKEQQDIETARKLIEKRLKEINESKKEVANSSSTTSNISKPVETMSMSLPSSTTVLDTEVMENVKIISKNDDVVVSAVSTTSEEDGEIVTTTTTTTTATTVLMAAENVEAAAAVVESTLLIEEPIKDSKTETSTGVFPAVWKALTSSFAPSVQTSETSETNTVPTENITEKVKYIFGEADAKTVVAVSTISQPEPIDENELNTFAYLEYGPIDPNAVKVEESKIVVQDYVVKPTITSANQLMTGNTDAKDAMAQLKSKGVSGVISYVITELGFWTLYPLVAYILNEYTNANSNGDHNSAVSYFCIVYLYNGIIIMINKSIGSICRIFCRIFNNSTICGSFSIRFSICLVTVCRRKHY
jgi:hypothetical protein